MVFSAARSHIVPGGRFSETYYWESYFTMLGAGGKWSEDLLKCMADNCLWMTWKLRSHPPTANRTYYLRRSQPPVFALMVELFEEDGVRGCAPLSRPLTKMGICLWMDGAKR